MSKSKHTPGPLEYDPSNLCLYAPKGDGIVRVADLTPADTGNPQDEIPEDEVDANGRLFAAAPELLAALQEMVEAFQNYDSAPYGNSLAEWARLRDTEFVARSAIAKAESNNQ